MAQPYVGQIIAVGFNFTPVGWLACNGQAVPISQYDVLFTLIGTTYGGDGVSSFCVPDLRGRSPLNAGQGNGLSRYVIGQVAGAETVTLVANQVGAHSHTLMASSKAGNLATPVGGSALGQNTQTLVNVYAPPPSKTALSPQAIGAAPGGSQPHANTQPYLAINYIICWAGIYPSPQ